MKHEPGGGYPQKLDYMLAKHAPGCDYVQVTGCDLAFLPPVPGERLPGVGDVGRQPHAQLRPPRREVGVHPRQQQRLRQGTERPAPGHQAPVDDAGGVREALRGRRRHLGRGRLAEGPPRRSPSTPATRATTTSRGSTPGSSSRRGPTTSTCTAPRATWRALQPPRGQVLVSRPGVGPVVRPGRAALPAAGGAARISGVHRGDGAVPRRRGGAAAHARRQGPAVQPQGQGHQPRRGRGAGESVREGDAPDRGRQ